MDDNQSYNKIKNYLIENNITFDSIIDNIKSIGISSDLIKEELVKKFITQICLKQNENKQNENKQDNISMMSSILENQINKLKKK